MRRLSKWFRLNGLVVIFLVVGVLALGLILFLLVKHHDQPDRLTFTATDSGRQVQANVGSTIMVDLGSTYWSFQAPTGHSLAVLSTIVESTPCPVIGGGCGHVIATYRTQAAGSSQITASRYFCGEALKCSPSQSSFHLAVKIS